MRLVDLLVFAAVGSLVPFITLLLTRSRRNPTARYAVGILIGAVCFQVLPLAQRLGVHPVVLVPLVIGQVATTFFFWLFCLSVARDGFRPTLRHWWVLPAKIAFSLLSIRPDRPLLPPDLSAGEQWMVAWLPPALFSATLVCLSLLALTRGLAHDLVEGRKKLRITTLIVCCTAMLVIIPIKLGFSGQRLMVLSEVTSASILLIFVAFFSARFVHLDPALTLAEPESPGTSTNPEADAALEAQLDTLFGQEQYYRTEGLTIRALAGKLGVPEYRVRRLINGSLGFRNFNDFLNRHRIEAARAILADPGQQDLPILRIALDLGYRSLAGFNESFKKITGSTPTAFRKSATRAGSSDESA